MTRYLLKQVFSKSSVIANARCKLWQSLAISKVGRQSWQTVAHLLPTTLLVVSKIVIRQIVPLPQKFDL